MKGLALCMWLVRILYIFGAKYPLVFSGSAQDY